MALRLGSSARLKVILRPSLTGRTKGGPSSKTLSGTRCTMCRTGGLFGRWVNTCFLLKTILLIDMFWGCTNGSKIPFTPKVADFVKTNYWSFWLVHKIRKICHLLGVKGILPAMVPSPLLQHIRSNVIDIPKSNILVLLYFLTQQFLIPKVQFTITIVLLSVYWIIKRHSISIQ